MKWLGLVGLCALVGCSSGSSNPAPAGGAFGGSGTVSAVCEHDANAYCDKLAACAPFSLQWTYGTLEACKARDRLWCVGVLAEKDTGRTLAGTDACAGAVDLQSCQDFNDNVALDACVVAAGPRAAGQGCTLGDQCATWACRAPDISSCAVCAERTPIGGACTSSADCVSGSRCRAQICVPLVDEGAACGGTTGVCKYPFQCGNSTCARPIPLGGACDPALDLCDYNVGAMCDSTSNTCKPLVHLADAGQPCGALQDGVTECTAFGACVYSTPDSTTGTCKAPAADGAPCNDTDVGCFWPAICANGICQLPGAIAPAPGCSG